MAALRHGVKTVIIPAANEKELEEIDQTVRKALNFILVDHVDAVIDAALVLTASEDVPVQSKNRKPPVAVPHEAPKPKTGIRQ